MQSGTRRALRALFACDVERRAAVAGIAMAGVSFVLAPFVIAAGLSCTLTTSCPTGVVAFRMQATTNSHAQLASQSGYTQLVCCTGVVGLTSSCTGSYAALLKLSGVTNAHVEEATLAHYANTACLTVPSGFPFSVSYQNGSCTGYDTTVASISASTNAQVGGPSAYTRKVCATYNPSGTLSADIVDASGVSVASPSASMSSTSASFSCGTATGTFGTSSQKIRVTNGTSNPLWTVAVAASAGPTETWSSGPADYDFNDANGCTDGADADSYGGALTINPTVATVTPSSGCTNTGVSLGASETFAQGTNDSATLLNGGASSGLNCSWDLTGIAASQSVPAEQDSGTYEINLTITVIAI